MAARVTTGGADRETDRERGGRTSTEESRDAVTISVFASQRAVAQFE